MAIVIVLLFYLLQVTDNKVILAEDKIEIERKQGDAMPVFQETNNQTLHQNQQEINPWLTPRMTGLICGLSVLSLIFLSPHIYKCCLMYF